MNSPFKPQEAEEQAEPIPFQPFKKGETARSLQTLLRNNNRTFVKSLSMVDNKANIMIHLNSLLLSGIAVFAKFFAPFMMVEKVALLLLVVSCIISLVLAALAARPVRSLHMHASHQKKEEYLFGKSHHHVMPQEEFLAHFDAVIRDQGLIYKNIALEFYTLSKLLTLKNNRLRGSYDILIVGIIITGVIIILYDVFRIGY